MEDENKKKSRQDVEGRKRPGMSWRGTSPIGNGEAPCLGCARRKLGCHDGCPDYIAYKERKDAKATVERKARMRRTAGWIPGKR